MLDEYREELARYVAGRKNEIVAIPQRERTVTVFLVDGRCDKMVAVLRGKMKVPLPVCKDGARVRWKVPNFKKVPAGLVCDVSADSMNIVFPFLNPTDAQHASKLIFFTFEDIVNLFLHYDHRLKLVARTGGKG